MEEMKLSKLWFDDEFIHIEMNTGKRAKMPLREVSSLELATDEQRRNYTVSAFGIHWAELDEDLSFEGFFNYVPPVQTELRKNLGRIPDIVSMSYIAQRYFGKSRTWLYQRINGNKVNGKTASFTPAELLKLNEAIQDISRELGEVKV